MSQMSINKIDVMSVQSEWPTNQSINQSLQSRHQHASLINDRSRSRFRFFTPSACALVNIRPARSAGPTRRYFDTARISIRMAENHCARMRRRTGNRAQISGSRPPNDHLNQRSMKMLHRGSFGWSTKWLVFSVDEGTMVEGTSIPGTGRDFKCVELRLP